MARPPDKPDADRAHDLVHFDALRDAFNRKWTEGQRPGLEEFLVQVEPNGREALLRVLLAVEANHRRELGEAPEPRDYLDRFPDYHRAIEQELAWSDLDATMQIAPEQFISKTVTWSDSVGGAFQSLPPESLELLMAQMQERRYAVGECLFRQGEPGDSLLLINEGEVDIVLQDENEEPHAIDRSGPGEILGEMALLTEEPRSASVVARTPVTALRIQADDFHRLAARFPEISVVLTQLMARRLGKSKDVLSGKTFDRYRIERRLGRGAQSVVYEGFDVEEQRRVALKMMSHRLVYDTEARQQFQREADIIESFRHDNVVGMFGRFAAFHTFFIATELCDGIDLQERLATRGVLNEQQFRSCFGQLASAVAYAHHRGVFHRDIKPANVMINRDGQVKLMDFGLAKPLAEQIPCAPGRIVGTPRYMAPEQLAGQSIDHRVDSFALGCLAYELLQGKPLFGSESFAALVESHRNWRGTPLGELCPQLSADTAALFSTCLHPWPENRHLDLEAVSRWGKKA